MAFFIEFKPAKDAPYVRLSGQWGRPMTRECARDFADKLRYAQNGKGYWRVVKGEEPKNP